MPVEGETYDDENNILNKVQIDHDAAKANQRSIKKNYHKTYVTIAVYIYAIY